jgi:hypothetical protein
LIKWFEGNPIGIALASACGAMVLVSLLLGVVWSLPPSASGDTQAEENPVPELDVLQIEDSEPLDLYAVITERPVFNETRLPVLEEELDGDDDQEEEVEVDAPNVELVGVVITPSIRMVTLKVPDQPESLVAFEGQPLEGNFGSWQVSRIGYRDITLSSESGDKVELQLLVHDVKIQEPPATQPATSTEPEKAGKQTAGGEEPLSRAEEIRQRIAQRREELRRAAEEKEQEEEGTPDYSKAIQSMISGSRRKPKKDEND